MLTVVFRSIRPRQWSKNLLILFPAIASHHELDGVFLVRLALGFVSFSAVASAMYLVNDLVDREADRGHPDKKMRPIAAGQLTPGEAGLVMALLAVIAVAASFLLPEAFSALLVIYVCLNIAYSLMLKRLIAIDVLTIVGFFVLRLVAGGVLAGVPLTGWFLAFFAFLLVSVAFAKRVSELLVMGGGANGRGYSSVDVNSLSSFGIGCAITAVVVYCLYITGDSVAPLYARPELLWGGFPLLLYWVARLWLITGRGDLHHDPAEFVLRDPASYVVGLGMILVIWSVRIGLSLS